jgi:hypothetical protein
MFNDAMGDQGFCWSLDLTKTVAVISGEDSAPEAVNETIRVIETFGLKISWVYPDVGFAS